MERYRVVFEVRCAGTQWESESYSNGGRGLDLVEAIAIKEDLDRYGFDGEKVRNVRIEEI